MDGLRIGLGIGVGSGNRLPPYVDMQFLYEGFNVAETPYTFSQLISFTRTSAATYVNSAGNIVSAPAGTPRFDYDPVTLQPRGLLIEEQRTNLLLRSEEFDAASWVKSRSSVTVNATTSPDGTVDADKLVEDTTASATHRVFQQAAKAASSLTRTFSVYLKASERTFARVQVSDNTEVVVARTDIDLSAGTATAASVYGGSSISAASASISPTGNGWYRVALTATFDATITNPGAFVFLCNSLSNISYTGDGISGLFVWGAQWEDASFATSYIPTVASQVTRTADQASIVAPNFAPWYNQSEGTFVVEFNTSISGAPAVTAYMIALDASGSKRIAYIGSGSESASTFDGSTIISSAGDVTGPISKTAMAYNATQRAISSNGQVATTGAVAAGFSSASSLNIGSAGSGGFLNGHIRRISYYPSRLSNAQLRALSA